MIEKHSVIKGIDYWTVWYAERPVRHKGVVSYKQATFDCAGSQKFETLISDLKESAEDIKKHFKSNCRNEVNRAEREGVVTECYEKDKLTDEMIDSFCAFFKEFWDSKGLSDNYDDALPEEMKTYRDNNNLAITAALLDNERVVYHTYLTDGDRVRLWHSASLYRESGEGDDIRKLVGYANRYLHYKDMLYFSEHDYGEYDWGGAGHTSDVANITKFKEAFGGSPKIFYDYKKVVGLDTYIKLIIKKLLRK